MARAGRSVAFAGVAETYGVLAIECLEHLRIEEKEGGGRRENSSQHLIGHQFQCWDIETTPRHTASSEQSAAFGRRQDAGERRIPCRLGLAAAGKLLGPAPPWPFKPAGCFPVPPQEHNHTPSGHARPGDLRRRCAGNLLRAARACAPAARGPSGQGEDHEAPRWLPFRFSNPQGSTRLPSHQAARHLRPSETLLEHVVTPFRQPHCRPHPCPPSPSRRHMVRASPFRSKPWAISRIELSFCIRSRVVAVKGTRLQIRESDGRKIWPSFFLCHLFLLDYFPEAAARE